MSAQPSRTRTRVLLALLCLFVAMHFGLVPGLFLGLVIWIRERSYSARAAADTPKLLLRTTGISFVIWAALTALLALGTMHDQSAGGAFAGAMTVCAILLVPALFVGILIGAIREAVHAARATVVVDAVGYGYGDLKDFPAPEPPTESP